MRHGTPPALQPLRQWYTFALVMLAMLSACGSGVAGTSRPGVASAKFADWAWNIPGTCEFAGDDMTFTAPGDPLLSIGFNSAGSPTAVGNLSSQSKGFVSFIGHPDVAKPTVTIAGRKYTVSGLFFVDTDVTAHGDISITCD